MCPVRVHDAGHVAPAFGAGAGGSGASGSQPAGPCCSSLPTHSPTHGTFLSPTAPTHLRHVALRVEHPRRHQRPAQPYGQQDLQPHIHHRLQRPAGHAAGWAAAAAARAAALATPGDALCVGGVWRR